MVVCMSKFREIYAKASRLGLDLLPSSATDEEQLQHIAQQLGMDYDGSSAIESAMCDTMDDMEAEQLAAEEYNDAMGYDQEGVENYGREADTSKQVKKQADKGEGETTGTETGTETTEKKPGDNGYDPNKKPGDKKGTDSENPVETGTGSNGVPNQNGTNEVPETKHKKLDKPGENNPNNNVNQNGARPDLGNGFNSQTATQAEKASKQASSVGSRNFEHQQRIQKGKKAEEAASSKGKSGNSGSGSKAPEKKGGLAKKGLGNNGLAKKNSLEKAAKDFKKKQRRRKMKENLAKLGGFLLRHPFLIFVIILAILFLIILIAVIADEDIVGSSGSGRRTCTYSVGGVSSSGTIEISNVMVEIVNCDATKENYRVLETVEFEKYVLGVALAEAGPSSPDEALKAQMIAVRNFTLTRNQGMCPSNPDNCFHGYNQSSGVIRMRACTNDQVYWDYEKNIYQQTRTDMPSLYSPEVNSGHLWKAALSETDKARVEALAQEVIGEVLLDENGDVMKLGYMKAETDTFIADANSGMKYLEILNHVYGSSEVSEAKCTNIGNIDYGDYTLSSEGHTILHEPLSQFLTRKGTSIEEFNELITKNVNKAGFGTRAGVVAAAVTLIGELGDNYGVKVPYYWGGGHADGVKIGAVDYWGSDDKCTTYANNQTYDYCGLDCSGFVPWAIKNGGFTMAQMLASDFQYIKGARRVSLRANEAVLLPGDLLESEGHIVLVVGVDEEAKQYICAEAAGNQYGVLFMRRSFAPSGYWGVQMDDYYANPSNIRSQ